MIKFSLDSLLKGASLDIVIDSTSGAMQVGGKNVISESLSSPGDTGALCSGSVIENIDDVMAPPNTAQVLLDSLLTTDGKIPVKNLAEVAMFQQQINAARCACTQTGYSGVTLEDDGTLLTYGNTSFVGCGEFANGELSGELMACYVVGGVDCEVATPSELEGDEFSMAAYRE